MKCLSNKILGAMLFLAFSGAVLADDAAIEKARALIAQKDFKAAYELLAPLESDMAGNVEFDYLLGTAGVESGEITRGMFALERVLAVQPNNTAARAEVAKAHFKLGETESAKGEFENILSQNPNEELTKAINRYMGAIDKALGLTTTFNAYLDFSIGHDSNINSATSSDTIRAPGISPTAVFNLSNNSQETSDNFRTLAGGISVRIPVNDKWSVFSGVNLQNRFNQHDDNFDNFFLDFNLGMRYKHLRNTVSLAFQANTFELDRERFRNSAGASAQWQHDLDDRNQISFYGQMADLTYKGAEIRDANRYLVGGGWIHLFEGDKSPVLFLGPYIGSEQTNRDAGDFLSHSIYGFRAGGQLSFTPQWVGYANASIELRDYDARDPAFRKTRDDEQYELTIGARYIPARNWLIRPQISYINNESNIVINDYDRTVLSVNFRHDFNW